MIESERTRWQWREGGIDRDTISEIRTDDDVWHPIEEGRRFGVATDNEKPRHWFFQEDGPKKMKFQHAVSSKKEAVDLAIAASLGYAEGRSRAARPA